VRALIDGHNALGALRIRAPSHEVQRDALLRRVASIAPGATVFFDARSATGPQMGSPNRYGLKVVFCRKREADAAILDAVRDADAPHLLTVVTNDGEVRGRARQLGAQAKGVADFFGASEPAPPQERGPPPRTGPRMTPKDFGLPDEVDLTDPDLD